VLEQARAAVAEAHGAELQAGASPNPTLVYSHEQTGDGRADSRQDIAGIEQSIEFAKPTDREP
jgi:hypothetical protein